ncbi:hypothetical protein G9409_11065 [Chlorobium sp. BLA1]|nr:hypothetical protein [Candidatus Chlorobium masyuteum]
MFTGFLGLLMNYAGKPMTVIQDNASFHKGKAVQPMLKVLAQKELRLYFLPTYYPELNRIEKFWHKGKYELMEFKTRNIKTLEENFRKKLGRFLGRLRNDFLMRSSAYQKSIFRNALMFIIACKLYPLTLKYCPINNIYSFIRLINFQSSFT